VTQLEIGPNFGRKTAGLRVGWTGFTGLTLLQPAPVPGYKPAGEPAYP
jgi:hypothetical protein